MRSAITFRRLQDSFALQSKRDVLVDRSDNGDDARRAGSAVYSRSSSCHAIACQCVVRQALAFEALRHRPTAVCGDSLLIAMESTPLATLTNPSPRSLAQNGFATTNGWRQTGGGTRTQQGVMRPGGKRPGEMPERMRAICLRESFRGVRRPALLGSRALG